jgi:hypothetical protein
MTSCLLADGARDQYAANIIAEQLYTEGHTFAIMDEITDHKKNVGLAVTTDDQCIVSPNSYKSTRKTTKGWQFCVRWKDGSLSWVDLKVLKVVVCFDGIMTSIPRSSMPSTSSFVVLAEIVKFMAWIVL